MRRLITSLALLSLVLVMVSPVFGEGGQESDGERPAEITYWEMMWGPAESYTAAVEALVDRYNELHPDVDVTVQMTPWSNFYQTFLTAVTSGAAPDVSTGAFPQAIQYAQMGEILYLDSILEEWEEEDHAILDDFVEGSIELHQYNGQQAGIPWNADPRPISYRTDIFEEAGITELPETWEEFIDAAIKIRDNTDVIPIVFPVADQGGTQTTLNWLFSNGVGPTTEDVEANFTDPRVIETLEFFSTLYNEGLVPEGIVSYLGADAERLYYSGEAAIYAYGVLSALPDYPDVNENTEIMVQPIGPSSDRPRSLTWLNAMMAYGQTEEPEAAKSLIKWWSENNLPLWPEGRTGAFPARQSYMEDPYFSRNQYQRQVTERTLPYATPPVYPAESLFPAFAQIEGENFLAIALQDVVSGRTDYEAIAEKVNGMLEDALE